jgi:hypothetical protein
MDDYSQPLSKQGAGHEGAQNAAQADAPPTYNAGQKAQAVLAVWTEKARPAEICRQLSINWVSFNQPGSAGFQPAR